MMRAIGRFGACALVAIPSVGAAAVEITEHFECSEMVDATRSLHDTLELMRDQGRITGAQWRAEQWMMDDSTVGHALARDASVEQTGFEFVSHGSMTTAIARDNRTGRIDFDRHGDVIAVKPVPRARRCASTRSVSDRSC